VEFRTIQRQSVVIRARRIRLDKVEPFEARESKETTIAEYKTRNLSKFPPIAVQAIDGGRYAIVNGHHRYYARKDLGYKTIMAWIMPNGQTWGALVLWRGRVLEYDAQMWGRTSHRNVEHRSRPVDNTDVLK